MLGDSGYGPLSTTAPVYALSAERHLTGGLWLIFTGGFGYVHGDVPVTVERSPEGESTTPAA